MIFPSTMHIFVARHRFRSIFVNSNPRAYISRTSRMSSSSATSFGAGRVFLPQVLLSAETMRAAFDKIKFAPAAVRGKRTYDDGKFVKSLRDQAARGRALSEKQLAALKKLAEKYASQFPDRSVVSWLGVGGEAPAAAEAPGASAPADPAPLFAALGKVSAWQPPARKGRFSFDDKKFFQSLKQQYDTGKSLSFKQLAALKKLAAKYGVLE